MFKSLVYAIFIAFLCTSCAKRDPFYDDTCVSFAPVCLKVGDTIRFRDCGMYKLNFAAYYKNYYPISGAHLVGTYVYFQDKQAMSVVNDTGSYDVVVLEFQAKSMSSPKVKRIGTFQVQE